jgi:hypothetical protein
MQYGVVGIAVAVGEIVAVHAVLDLEMADDGLGRQSGGASRVRFAG